MNIAIIQPIVPTYREEFYTELQKYCSVDVYTFKDYGVARKEATETSSFNCIPIKNVKRYGFVIYDPRPFLSKNYDVIVLMMLLNHPSALFLELTKFIHRKKIILWGQGISVQRYLQEEIKPDWKLGLQMKIADGVWFYMEKECNQWSKRIKNKPMVALNNTVTKTDYIITVDVKTTKEQFKKKHHISQKTILIFCARFESNSRRTDLLLEAIKRLSSTDFGFIIIGAGKNKPDFNSFPNVYDFGAVYDRQLKDELFSIADVYFQPGWVGLSIVEAMAYAKPICTFIRSKETLQCVEYSYIEDGINGYIFNDIDDCINKLTTTPLDKFREMGENARELVRTKLTPQKMAENAFSVIKRVVGL